MLKGTSMLKRANSQNHHTKDSQCAALSYILQLSSITVVVEVESSREVQSKFNKQRIRLLSMTDG